jgi:hypothetical protein
MAANGIAPPGMNNPVIAARDWAHVYANMLVDSHMSEQNYNEKRDELKQLLDGNAGEPNIQFNMGVQQVNVNAEEHGNINDLKLHLIALIQRIRAENQDVKEEAKAIIDSVFEQVWGGAAQVGGYRRRRKTIRNRKGRKSSTHRRNRKGRGRARKTRRN